MRMMPLLFTWAALTFLATHLLMVLTVPHHLMTARPTIKLVLLLVALQLTAQAS
jgi:hypothetical protein